MDPKVKTGIGAAQKGLKVVKVGKKALSMKKKLPGEKKKAARKAAEKAAKKAAKIALKTEKKQLEAAQKISVLGLSVRQAELLCKNMAKETPVKKEPEIFAVDYVAECEKQLSKHLGRGVKIVNGKRKGKFELEFYGQDDLQNLLDALMKLQK